MTVVAADKVVFSKRTKLKISPFGTPRAAIVNVGLLGKGVPFNMETTMRKKIDAFPEVTVAEAIQAQNASIETTLREWKKETLLIALGMFAADMDEVAGGDVPVAGEAFTLNANRIMALQRRPKAAPAPIIKSGATVLVAGTDYDIWTDLEGRAVVAGKGAVAVAGAQLTADYTYTNAAATEQFTVELEELLTNGGTRKLWMPKASISIRGALDFFTDETGGDTPIRINAIQDPTLDYLALLENILAA
jgi:hypothetical protein